MKNVTPWPVRPWGKGQKITEPGIYSGVPMDVYHGDCCDGPSFSSTTLRKVEDPDVSMEEVYETLYLNPDRADEEEKEVWIRGRAVHHMHLGEKSFRQHFIVRPETYPDGAVYPATEGAPKPWNGNAKWCRAWLADQAMNKMSVLKPDFIPNVLGMAKKLDRDATIRAGLLHGLIEHSIFWRDPVTGLWLKARPDVLPEADLTLADYKGAAEVGAQAVRKSISNYGYHQQLALVIEGLYQVTGRVITEQVLVFQKWTRPWSINIKPIDGQAIFRGRQQNRRAIDRLAQCVATDTWPGHDDDGVTAGLQDWLEKRLTWEEANNILPAIEPDITREPRGYTATVDASGADEPI